MEVTTERREEVQRERSRKESATVFVAGGQRFWETLELLHLHQLHR